MQICLIHTRLAGNKKAKELSRYIMQKQMTPCVYCTVCITVLTTGERKNETSLLFRTGSSSSPLLFARISTVVYVFFFFFFFSAHPMSTHRKKRRKRTHTRTGGGGQYYERTTEDVGLCFAAGTVQ
jgi:uncharacterized protein involved in tolerance to divalent cations